MPTLLQRYKSSERTFYKKVSAALVRSFRSVAAAWKRFLHAGSQSVSILVVAHSETPPKGLRISLFGLAGLGMLAAAVLVFAFAFSGALGGARARVCVDDHRRRNPRGSLLSARSDLYATRGLSVSRCLSRAEEKGENK